MSRRRETFVPIDPECVTMYVCGPTVYNYIHIGNARPAVVFDVLFRVLCGAYPRVIYARNITDVEDKIMVAAREAGEDIDTFTSRFIDAYHEDVAALMVLEPTVEPRATQHLPQMINMIAQLLRSEHAYVAEGHVLFSITSMSTYGRLSGRNREDMIAGARVEVAPYKRDPADFVLWKPSTSDQPGWDSPWGRGRPGWHLECSAMTETHLGSTIDIHGGGQDLIFPHHENEIAQSICAHEGTPYVRYWVHNGYITASGDKMSKSLGNFATVRELLQQAPGEAIRFALLSGHYRQPLDWSSTALQQARASLDRLYNALRRVGNVRAGPGSVRSEVIEALDDDLNTPLAITRIHALANELNKTGDAAEMAALKGELLASGGILGLLQQDPEAWFRWAPAGAKTTDDATIDAMVTERWAAREGRDFARADEIRDRLQSMGIVLEDAADGTRWRRVEDDWA